MNTKEASKLWSMSPNTIADRCKEGMIPLAEKIRGRWEIPEGSIAPILTRHQACTYFSYLAAIQEGAEPKSVNKEGFQFLADAAFITKLGDGENYLKDVRITKLGMDLLDDYNSYRKKKGLKELNFKGGLNFGVAYGEIEVKK